MSLQLKAIDRLFDRLAATYGSAWVRQWDGVDAKAVKAMWAHELGWCEKSLEPIAWALENLPDKCPNLIVFKNLCLQAPAKAVPQLPAPKADPERMRLEMEKLGQMSQNIVIGASKGMSRDWARRIVEDLSDGIKRNPTVAQMACDALRLDRKTLKQIYDSE